MQSRSTSNGSTGNGIKTAHLVICIAKFLLLINNKSKTKSHHKEAKRASVWTSNIKDMYGLSVLLGRMWKISKLSKTALTTNGDS